LHETYSLSEAKTRFSEIINRVYLGRKEFTITKKGKAVAVVVPLDEEAGKAGGEGLIRAKGALAQIDRMIDELVNNIYEARSKETPRKLSF